MTLYGELIFSSALPVTIPTRLTPTAAAETTAADGALFAWTCKVHGERTTAVVFSMEHGNGTLGFFSG